MDNENKVDPIYRIAEKLMDGGYSHMEKKGDGCIYMAGRNNDLYIFQQPVRFANGCYFKDTIWMHVHNGDPHTSFAGVNMRTFDKKVRKYFVERMLEVAVKLNIDMSDVCGDSGKQEG